MQRTTSRNKEIKQVDAILTSDWHLRDSVPSCRLDDFESAQWDKVKFISELQQKYNCPVYHAGDLFHHWKPSPYLISKAIEFLPNNFYTIYGNHDLPQHNLELANKCGIYALEKAGRIKVLNGRHWEQDAKKSDIIKIGNRKILIWHVMNYQGKKPWPGYDGPMAAGLIRKIKGVDLILTGHNHQQFVEKFEGKLLVNPGSITRQTSDQKDFQPAVFLYDAEANAIQKVSIPIKKGVVEKAIETTKIEERNERIDSFISKLNGEWQSGINFDENLERFLTANKIDTEVKRIINEITE